MTALRREFYARPVLEVAPDLIGCSVMHGGSAGVIVETLRGRATLAPEAAPLTHWNPKVFEGPLFNPQDGKALKVTAVRKPGGRAGQLWSLRGDAEIDDWYDEQSVWTALRGRLKDGSTLEYRRI